MSEYEYDFYPAEEENINFLDHNYFINPEYNKSLSFELDNKNEPTNYMPNEPQTPTQERSISHLATSEQVKTAYLACRKGKANETMQLHTNFKSITNKFLKELLCLKLLSPKQVRNALHFMKTIPSFANFKALFQQKEETENLRGKMLKFYSSPQFVKQILGSQVKMGQKLRMLKFIQKLRTSMDCEQTKKWKGW